MEDHDRYQETLCRFLTPYIHYPIVSVNICFTVKHKALYINTDASPFYDLISQKTRRQAQ